MRSHTAISLRSAKATLSWVVAQAQENGRTFVLTVHGEPAAAVVPFASLQQLDAKSSKRARKIASLASQLAALLPGAATGKAGKRNRTA